MVVFVVNAAAFLASRRPRRSQKQDSRAANAALGKEMLGLRPRMLDLRPRTLTCKRPLILKLAAVHHAGDVIADLPLVILQIVTELNDCS